MSEGSGIFDADGIDLAEPALAPDPDEAVRAWARALNPVELDALVEAFDGLPAASPQTDAGHALKRALNDEEARRVRAGEPVIYTGRNR